MASIRCGNCKMAHTTVTQVRECYAMGESKAGTMVEIVTGRPGMGYRLITANDYSVNNAPIKDANSYGCIAKKRCNCPTSFSRCTLYV